MVVVYEIGFFCVLFASVTSGKSQLPIFKLLLFNIYFVIKHYWALPRGTRVEEAHGYLGLHI